MGTQKPMEFIGLFSGEKIFLPKNLNEMQNSLIIKVNHINPRSKIFWYLNDTFISTTMDIHEIAIQPKKGIYTITVVDEMGNELKKNIEIFE